MHCKFEAIIREIAAHYAQPEDYEDAPDIPRGAIPDLTLVADHPKLRPEQGYFQFHVFCLEPLGDRLYPLVHVDEVIYRTTQGIGSPVWRGGHIQIEIVDGAWRPCLLNLSSEACEKIDQGNYPKDWSFRQLRSIRPDAFGHDVTDQGAVRLMEEFMESWADQLWDRWSVAGVKRIVPQVC